MRNYSLILVLVLTLFLAIQCEVLAQADQLVGPEVQSQDELIKELLQRLEEAEEEIASLRLDIFEWNIRSILLPTYMEQKAITFTAYHNAPGPLSEKLQRISMVARYDEDSEVYVIGVDTTPQPTWNYHIGKGRFSVSDREIRAAYKEAGDKVFSLASDWLLSQNPKEVVIYFSVMNWDVGVWHDHTFTLVGE